MKSTRRLIYHQTILQREEKELTKRVYKAQKNEPTTGDFVKLLGEDFILINKSQDDKIIEMTNKTDYKQLVKKAIKEAAFNYLKEKQKEHSKVKLLCALRSRGTECKANFKQKYTHTNLLCVLCKDQTEDQQHILSCRVLLKEFKTDELTIVNIKYEDIFSEDIRKQKSVTSLFYKLFKIRKILVDMISSQEAPSNTDVMLEMSHPLLPCIVNLSSGK